MKSDTEQRSWGREGGGGGGDEREKEVAIIWFKRG